MDEISERLKRLRDQLGYSQEGIAASIGMKQTTWAGWEQQPPEALVRLKKLAEKYGLTADYILGLTNVPSRVELADLSETMQEIVIVGKQLPVARQRDLLSIAHAFAAQDQEESSVADAIAKATGRKPDAPRIVGGEE